MTKPTILILIGSMWPGNDASGPNLSIRAQCESLAGEFDFRIVARDRAFGSDRSIVEQFVWHDLGYAKALYLPIGRTGATGLARLLRTTPHDLLILNGFFDREFTLPALLARKAGMAGTAPVLLSPRGEFTGGALALKSRPKALFRRIASLAGLHHGVHFHATSAAELSDIETGMPGYPVTLVPNFRPLFQLPPHVPREANTPVRLAFLGRISPVKGLDTALRALAAAGIPAKFDIYGPISDAAHWAQCQTLIDGMDDQVEVVHHGEISNDDAPLMLAAHDAMLMPSLSENFGHAIFESLASGTPVIIGDQTPWQNLASSSAGFVCTVGDIGEFASAVKIIAAMSATEAEQWRIGARLTAENYVRGSDAATAMAALFRRLME